MWANIQIVSMLSIDDVLVCSETFDGHLQDLANVFSRVKNAGLKLNPQKCSFTKSSCICLGHHISSQGIKPPPDRVQVLQKYPPPEMSKNYVELKVYLDGFDNLSNITV